MPVEITLKLADGRTFSKVFLRLPRFWASTALTLAPYGSNLQGCTFTRRSF